MDRNEMARIIQNVIEEAEENIKRLESETDVFNRQLRYGVRRHDIDEAVKLVEELSAPDAKKGQDLCSRCTHRIDSGCAEDVARGSITMCSNYKPSAPAPEPEGERAQVLGPAELRNRLRSRTPGKGWAISHKAAERLIAEQYDLRRLSPPSPKEVPMAKTIHIPFGFISGLLDINDKTKREMSWRKIAKKHCEQFGFDLSGDK
jgi:hypothetical protein